MSTSDEATRSWTCALCGREFLRVNQTHACRVRSLDDCFHRKLPVTRDIYNAIDNAFSQLTPCRAAATKTMIVFTNKMTFAYIPRIGKNSVDLVLPFSKPFRDNECFYKIAEVPGSTVYNHYCRIFDPADINEELRTYMKMAVDQYG